MEYLISWHDEDPFFQPLLDLEGWLRAIGGVNRNWIIGFDYSFGPQLLILFDVLLTGFDDPDRGDAHVEEVVHGLWSQRSQNFRDAIRDTIIEILQCWSNILRLWMSENS